jgi:hypothetical protein
LSNTVIGVVKATIARINYAGSYRVSLIEVNKCSLNAWKRQMVKSLNVYVKGLESRENN